MGQKPGKLRWMGGGSWWAKTGSGGGRANAGTIRAEQGGIYACV